MNDCIKRIRLEHAFNIRDLGGYCAADGKSVKWNTLFRGDGLSALTEKEWDVLYRKGVRTVVDLRSTAESRRLPDGCPEGIALLLRPMQTESEETPDEISPDTRPSDLRAFVRSVEEGYREIVRDDTKPMAAALEAVIRSLKDGAVLFHCTAGKDRTGIIAALLYRFLGVDDEDIIADYQVSCTYNDRGINRELAGNPELAALKHLKYSNPEDMAALLAYFREIGVEKRLEENGFSPALIGELKSRALEDGPEYRSR